MKLTSARSITVESDATATTTEPSYSASYTDHEESGASDARDAVGALTGTTPVAVIGAPSGGRLYREVESLSVYNADTVTHLVTVKKLDGSTGYTRFAASLGAGESLAYDGKGWHTYTAAGELKTNTAAAATSSPGAKNGATVTATERGYGPVHQTTLTFAATPITVRDAQTGGGVKVYDFPEGRILFLGATGSVAITTTSIIANTLLASKTCNWGIGTTTQANGTLATTEQNIINTANVTSSATINVAGAAANAAGVLTPVDGTATAADAFLNIGVASGADISADAAVTVTGQATISWINLGDV